MLKYFKMIMKKIIDEFPILKTNPSLVYLDNACSALKMKSAAYEQLKVLLEFGSCGGERGVHILARGVEEKYQIARKYIANSINCSENEIIFTSGTTEGFNILANSFNFKEGDEIIISGLEHNSVFLPFYRIAKIKKLKLKIIPLKNFNPDPLEFKKMITSKTRVLCLSKASNIFGGTVETDEIVEIAFRKNIKVFMDAAQYAPTHKIDVEKLKVDALCFSGHKVGAPYGTGILYIKNELYDFLSSSKLGGGTIKEIKKENGIIKVEFLKGYRNFEAGIQNYAGATALLVAYKYLNALGFEKIRKNISELVLYTTQKLLKIKGIKILGKNLTDGSIVSFISENKNFSNQDFALFVSNYKDKNIAIRTGRMCADLACINAGIKSAIRLSFFIYNKKEDVDIFITALKDYIKSL
jgi:selenocysteine lyase/cysteine desulfurase